MNDTLYPHLFSPLHVGSMLLPNRVVMVPTDISSGNANGSVNQRVITYHEQIAKGGCGFIIVGATTPDKATGRPTVTCLAADEDPLIPGLASDSTCRCAPPQAMPTQPKARRRPPITRNFFTESCT